MRRHMTMEQLAQSVLAEARTATAEKTASIRAEPALTTDMGRLLSKVAQEIRTYDRADLTYADIAEMAEARLGQR